ncbi:tRNA (adenine(22)-N(1))-methyltransferase TrmK [Paenibacillus sp. GSMTC-2017]|uniref:tRNA (adenine(22)-N(1))-methyltransferase n=1 Tax=Paenibacillus sp. GSMTC-2017 TaxID=2794350 RepID=UPI0018D964DE|nr:class I SAM-dependent methyltransferase [Paenibacillus sp. GSMTC-2017]MBH5318115.1 tRNA (adenine(22)-N(1))-methyltransferase TrmK [Paenibacillus sp. GSMTC-2017]
MIKLSKRLQRIADYITINNRVADIGSDHALLPVYLLQSGKCPSAIAGELNYGPMLAAKKQAADAGLTNRLNVRQGNGLAVLEAGEVDTVTIAGMGGSLMSEILEAGYIAGKLDGVSELVLQPNVGEDAVRIWLLNRGWKLNDETILEEDGKIYEVLHASKSTDAAEHNEKMYDGSFLQIDWDKPTLTSYLIRMGPYLLRNPHPALIKKWKNEINKIEWICDKLSSSDLPESALKRKQFQAEMKSIQEVLNCLQMDKQ